MHTFLFFTPQNLPQIQVLNKKYVEASIFKVVICLKEKFSIELLQITATNQIPSLITIVYFIFK